MAGVWSTTLDLDDGLQQISFHLSEDGHVSSTANIPAKPWHRWEAKTVDGTKSLKFKLYLGAWELAGTGLREGNSLRCASMSGAVMEGQDDPVYVGEFKMKLALPAADAEEEKGLRKQHKAKVDAKPAPPPKFRWDAFVGRWRLLVALDSAGDAMPSVDFHSIELNADRTFASVPGAATARGVLAGRWGVYDKTLPRNLNQGPTRDQVGTHVWLRVNRERCTGLDIQESFSMWGKPMLDSPLGMLSARSDEGSAEVDGVDGAVFYGASMDKEWAIEGRFSLAKEESIDREEGAEEGAAPLDEQPSAEDWPERRGDDAGEPIW